MSNDDIYRRPRDRQAFVADVLATIGLTLQDPTTRLPTIREAEAAAFIGPRLPHWWREREGWVYVGDYPMSRDLYEKLGGRLLDGFEPEVAAMPPIDVP